MNRAIFISDLHLNRVSSAKNNIFIKACEYFALNTEKLYILGDFWESWIGDDSLTYQPWRSGFGEISQALKNLAQRISVNFMVGNRDFTLSEEFFDTHNLRKISDPHIENFGNQLYYITHGDFLCLDDTEHIKMSKIIRSPKLVSEFLAKPLSQRIAILDQYVHTNEKYLDISMDYTINLLAKNHCQSIIHGHIHQPQVSKIGCDDINYQRICLHNWDEQAGMLVYDGKSFNLKNLDIINEKITLSDFIKNENYR